jgi:predicted flap endonuclease-1-like 5' DNA nuclease
LFFMLISFLLGLLTGWLIWGRKIEAMLATLAQKEDSIKDLNAKLTIKETDLNKANADIDVLRLSNRTHEEEKGQLRVDLYDAKEMNMDLISKLSAAMAAPVSVAAVAASTIDADANVAIEDHSTSVEFDVETPSDLPVSDATPEALSTIIENDVDDIPPPITGDLEVTNDLSFMAKSEALTAPTETIEEPAIEEPMLVAKPDNLKIVEGIGPKIEELCNGIDIWTWKQLSETSVDRLQEMLDAAGKRYQIHNPSTWPAQALMAHDGKWDELKVYQDHLKGGKEPEK